MQVQPVHQSWTSYMIIAGVMIIVVGLRLRQASKMQRLRLGSLWIVPALYLAVGAFMFAQFPPTGWVWIACLVALGLGAALGWQRGRMMHISVDPVTQSLSQKASPAAMLFLVALILVRSGGRMLIGTGSDISPAMLTDPLIAFALGMFTLQRVEMYLRAKRLLGESRRGA